MRGENARHDLAAINATLALFKQDGEVRPHRGLSRMFRRAELFALCSAALEAAGRPIDTRELAKAVAEAKGLDGQEEKCWHLPIVSVMARQAAMFGLGAFSGMLIAAIVKIAASYFNVHSNARHVLDLYIDGKTISINVSSIDKENPKKLDHAIRAIGLARKRATC
jgi:hypothetical protein